MQVLAAAFGSHQHVIPPALLLVHTEIYPAGKGTRGERYLQYAVFARFRYDKGIAVSFGQVHGMGLPSPCKRLRVGVEIYVDVRIVGVQVSRIFHGVPCAVDDDMCSHRHDGVLRVHGYRVSRRWHCAARRRASGPFAVAYGAVAVRGRPHLSNQFARLYRTRFRPGFHRFVCCKGILFLKYAAQCVLGLRIGKVPIHGR